MRIKKDLVKVFLILGDILLMYVALFLILGWRCRDFSFWPCTSSRPFVWHFSVLHFFWLVFLFILNFYDTYFLKNSYRVLRNLIVFALLAGGLGALYFYLPTHPGITPKRILFLDVLLFSIFLLMWRVFLMKILKLLDIKERIVIVELNPGFISLLEKALMGKDYEISLFYHSSPGEKHSSQGEEIAKCGITSEIAQLKKVIEQEKVETIVFSPEFYKNEKLVRTIFANIPLRLNFVNLTDFYEELTKTVLLDSVNELWFLENISRPESKIYSMLKRGFDIILSLIMLLISLSLIPFIILAIKLDSPGPVFYVQKRPGKDRKVFNLYKFRTLRASPDQYTRVWREQDPNQVTRAGKMLRKLYLDEIPQCLNILKGDISFIGPRPEWLRLASVFEKEIPFYSLRYMVRPGFFGWAQLSYPASTTIEQAKEKFQYDLYYIKNQSLFFDLEIILKAIRIILKKS